VNCPILLINLKRKFSKNTKYRHQYIVEIANKVIGAMEKRKIETPKKTGTEYTSYSGIPGLVEQLKISNENNSSNSKNDSEQKNQSNLNQPNNYQKLPLNAVNPKPDSTEKYQPSRLSMILEQLELEDDKPYSQTAPQTDSNYHNIFQVLEEIKKENQTTSPYQNYSEVMEFLNNSN